MNKLIIGGIALVASSVVALTMVEFKTVKGGQLGVMETWSDGVVDTVFQPKNYFLFPGYSKEIFTYDTTLLRYELPEYQIKSSDNQEMKIEAQIQWRRDPAKLVHHHKTFKGNAETVAIGPAMMSAILRHGTQYKAIDAYSGEGFIQMQSDIQNDLRNNDSLKSDGIIIETFIINHVQLNPQYVNEIQLRQLASLRQSRALEEQKAAEAEALVAKSKAQADLNVQVVAAERDQQVQVIRSKAEAEKTVIAAKAQAQQVELAANATKAQIIAEAEGKKQAAISEAEGILALGKSKAESQRLQLLAYAVEGADGYIKTKVAESMGQAFSGIKGFLPADMKLQIMANDYNSAVDVFTGAPIVRPPLANPVAK